MRFGGYATRLYACINIRGLDSRKDLRNECAGEPLILYGDCANGMETYIRSDRDATETSRASPTMHLTVGK